MPSLRQVPTPLAVAPALWAWSPEQTFYQTWVIFPLRNRPPRHGLIKNYLWLTPKAPCIKTQHKEAQTGTKQSGAGPKGWKRKENQAHHQCTQQAHGGKTCPSPILQNYLRLTPKAPCIKTQHKEAQTGTKQSGTGPKGWKRKVIQTHHQCTQQEHGGKTFPSPILQNITKPQGGTILLSPN